MKQRNIYRVLAIIFGIALFGLSFFIANQFSSIYIKAVVLPFTAFGISVSMGIAINWFDPAKEDLNKKTTLKPKPNK